MKKITIVIDGIPDNDLEASLFVLRSEVKTIMEDLAGNDVCPITFKIEEGTSEETIMVRKLNKLQQNITVETINKNFNEWESIVMHLRNAVNCPPDLDTMQNLYDYAYSAWAGRKS